MKNHQTLAEMEKLFLALADKTRLRMLNLLRGSEICVFLFTEILNESQPKISRHLAYLRNAGLVETRREGKLVNYRIANLSDPYLSILNNTLFCLETQPEMQAEFSKLAKHFSSKKNDEAVEVNFERNIYETEYMSPKKELEIYLL